MLMRVIDGLCACALGYFGLNLLAVGARQAIERLALAWWDDPRRAPARLAARLYRAVMVSPS
ncbi:MAG TPA: hypothetical protein VF808_02520 [Ktedonobacterales bacterium]